MWWSATRLGAALLFIRQTQDTRQIADDAELVAHLGLPQPLLHDSIGLAAAKDRLVEPAAQTYFTEELEDGTQATIKGFRLTQLDEE
jgi:hypothetical protein